MLQSVPASRWISTSAFGSTGRTSPLSDVLLSATSKRTSGATATFTCAVRSVPTASRYHVEVVGFTEAVKVPSAAGLTRPPLVHVFAVVARLSIPTEDTARARPVSFARPP